MTPAAAAGDRARVPAAGQPHHLRHHAGATPTAESPKTVKAAMRSTIGRVRFPARRCFACRVHRGRRIAITRPGAGTDAPAAARRRHAQRTSRCRSRRASRCPTGCRSPWSRSARCRRSTIRLVVQAGNLHEQANEMWLADLTGRMLQEGTQDADGRRARPDARGHGRRALRRREPGSGEHRSGRARGARA